MISISNILVLLKHDGLEFFPVDDTVLVFVAVLHHFLQLMLAVPFSHQVVDPLEIADSHFPLSGGVELVVQVLQDFLVGDFPKQ